MKTAAFNAVCPVEIGDKVRDGKTGRVRAITDIACTHYLKAGKVEFYYELDNSGQYITIEFPTAVEVKVTFRK